MLEESDLKEQERDWRGVGEILRAGWPVCGELGARGVRWKPAQKDTMRWKPVGQAMKFFQKKVRICSSFLNLQIKTQVFKEDGGQADTLWLVSERRGLKTKV